ncbi:uncharacterized protein DSM5745_09075 [Aspergillus mulundensis]|uniref:Uncharacterized protein n=1 Tax=Aspergillus mulundensis TaxID=1810919 RepID=A0A3D8QZK0_9EURO|nr:hypothetical protein DSM5745_09075 [Aspergillus mulundensis]RDW67209.1 hypothetical protein DSM5745_09075 [Aspergillus mulundensis]
MDELVNYIPHARWSKRTEHTSVCIDLKLESLWKAFASELALDGHDLQLWKLTGTGLKQLTASSALLIPVSLIPGMPEPRVLNGGPLSPESAPIPFVNEITISGSLYCVLAFPPKNPDPSQAI